MTSTTDIVAKLWSLCHVLRDDGVTYNEYVTELTFLLFLKMLEETGKEDRHRRRRYGLVCAPPCGAPAAPEGGGNGGNTGTLGSGQKGRSTGLSRCCSPMRYS